MRQAAIGKNSKSLFCSTLCVEFFDNQEMLPCFEKIKKLTVLFIYCKRKTEKTLNLVSDL